VFSCLSLAFSRLVHATLDPEPVVAQKAASLLDTLPHEALRAVLAALQLQFDCVIADRPYLLHTLRLLYTRQRHRAATLSWELFARRFNALCLEAQLAREPDTPVVDIYGQTEKNNAYLQRRTSMAKLALKRSAIIRHVRPETQQEVQTQPHQVLSALVSLLMTFMATCDSAKPSSASQGLHASADHLQPPAAAPHSPAAPEASAPVADKHQALLLRHLESLMCFSAAEQRFTAPSAQLRAHPCVHAFLAGLPAVLDRHLELGRLMLPTVLGLLRYLPSAPLEPDPPACTLGLLDSETRHYWLQTLIIVLYKYEFSGHAPSVRSLLHIALNTLNGQQHRCDLAALLDQAPAASDAGSLSASLAHNHLACDDLVDSPSSGRSRRFTVHNPAAEPRLHSHSVDSVANKRCLIEGLNQAKRARRGRFLRGVRLLLGGRSSHRMKKAKLGSGGRQNVIKLTRRSRIARGLLALFRSKHRKKINK